MDIGSFTPLEEQVQFWVQDQWNIQDIYAWFTRLNLIGGAVTGLRMG
jgi:hypothetical protein